MEALYLELHMRIPRQPTKFCFTTAVLIITNAYHSHNEDIPKLYNISTLTAGLTNLWHV
jgi:hypothetical protein